MVSRMANKSINELDNASGLANDDLLVLWQDSTNTACNLTGAQFATWLLALANGHGGVISSSYTPPVPPSLEGTLTLNMGDSSTITVPIMNGAKGDTGDTGATGPTGPYVASVDWASNSAGSPQGTAGTTDTYDMTLSTGAYLGSFVVYNGMNGAGAVSSVLGETPDENGNVDLTAKLLQMIYPVGSIYMSTNNVSPATFIGGTWTLIQGKFLLAAGDGYTAGDTGGEASHTLTAAESGQKAVTTATDGAHKHPLLMKYRSSGVGGGNVAYFHGDGDKSYDGFSTGSISQEYTGAHSHSISGSNATNAHNNMPPYLVVYVWTRTA